MQSKSRAGNKMRSVQATHITNTGQHVLCSVSDAVLAVFIISSSSIGWQNEDFAMVDLAKPPDVQTIDASRAAELVLDQKLPYLDVRTQEEFAMGHVEGAVNVPYLVSKPDGSREV